MSPIDNDIGRILEQLRTEVRAQHQALAQDSSTGESVLERQLRQAVEQLEITRVVSAHWPLEGQSLIQRAWIVVHKVVRRYLRWYINPIVEQQNAFNDVTARTLRLLVDAYSDLRTQVEQAERAAPPATSDRQRDIQSPRATEEAIPPTADLQALIVVQGTREPPALLSDLALHAQPTRLAERQTVNAHWTVTGNDPLTRSKALVKRIVRQYLRWMINPIVEQQNGHNRALTEIAPLMILVDATLRARVATLRATLAQRSRS